MKRLYEMINPQPRYDIKDFLLAVDFIQPKGMSLDSFIVPGDQESNFDYFGNDGAYKAAEDNTQKVEGVTDTITYNRKQPIDKISAGQWPKEYLEFLPNQEEAQGPSEVYDPQVTPVGYQKSPHYNKGQGTYAQLLNKNTNEEDLILKEALGPFPKNSLLKFKRIK